MNNPEGIINRVTEYFQRLDGCHGVALVGSRGRKQLVDRYSDADFLICVEQSTLQDLVRTSWTGHIAPVALEFPLVLPDEVRVLFQGYFDCDFHFYTRDELNELQGPCQLGAYISRGWRILYDPRGLLELLEHRVKAPSLKSEEEIFSVTPAVFWFNTVLCAKYILRGDLFRAYRLSNWWLQQMLLQLLEPNLAEESLRHKDVAKRLEPRHYQQLTRCFARLQGADMVRALEECMDFFWTICRDKPVPLSQHAELQFRTIHDDVRKLLLTGLEGM